MSRRNERRSAPEQTQRNRQQPSKRVDMRHNPLYPDRIESNAMGVLIAIAAVIVALICLVLIVKNFNYSARQHRQAISIMQTDQSRSDMAEAVDEPTDNYEEFDDYEMQTEPEEDLSDGYDSGSSIAEDPDDLSDEEQQNDAMASREGIHSYTVTVRDCTWTEAYNDCISMGGHLATIDSREEWDYVIQLLKGQNTGAYYFYLGGARALDDANYYWLDPEGSPYGNPVNSTSFWGSDLWLEGEPSYQDGDTAETNLAILYMKSADRWVLNDVANDTLYTEQYLAGKVAYICEYE